MLYNAWPVIITALLHALLCLSTYSTTQAGRHTRTHTLHLVLTVIYSTLALSPTLSVCSHIASHMSERERHRGRPRVGGLEGLKVKETERENLESEGYIHVKTTFTWLYASIHVGHECVFFRAVCYMSALRKFPLWVLQLNRHLRCITPNNLVLVFIFFTNWFLFAPHL